MDEERFYGYPDNSSNSDFRYETTHYENSSLCSNSTFHANSYRTENRKGVVCRPQEKDEIKLKRCPSPLLGKPLQDYDCSEHHDVSINIITLTIPLFLTHSFSCKLTKPVNHFSNTSEIR
jgi:hypothetical protein